MNFPAVKQTADSILQEKLNDWHEQIDVLSSAEKEFFVLEAQEKTKEAELYIPAEGKNIEEKKAAVYNAESWRDFAFKLAVKKATYLREKRVLELKVKCFEAAYLTFKLENEAIRKYPS